MFTKRLSTDTKFSEIVIYKPRFYQRLATANPGPDLAVRIRAAANTQMTATPLALWNGGEPKPMSRKKVLQLHEVGKILSPQFAHLFPLPPPVAAGEADEADDDDKGDADEHGVLALPARDLVVPAPFGGGGEESDDDDDSD